MSVIGIDFGNESCYVAAAKAGGIETLANDYSLRATPSFVAFDGKKRVIGVAAKNQQVTNMKNTVCGFKRLLGRRFNDPHVQRELKSIPTQVEELANGGIGIRVNYLDKEQLFKPEQLTAMLFTKLKETSTHALQAQVNDCVIACPVYFTNAERRALLDAAHIAGLNVLRLMNETTATALSYGFYKQDLPEDKPRNVVFVDCGNASLQVSAAAFNKGKLKMLASTWDQIGGRDFDILLAEYFTKDFSDRYKINAKNNARAQLRLLTEIEKLKKQMSANSTKLPLNIECFMNDMDVSGNMQRSEMEELCAHLFERVEQTFRRLLTESKLQREEIHSVEIVGGSSRIPAIKQLIEQVFGKPASTTLNQDESVSRGAALQCAIMSPAVRVREFGVTDIQNYAVKVQWDGESNGGEIEVFPVFHAAPFSRLLTLNRREPFCMNVLYAQEVPYPDPVIGRWIIKDVKPTERGEPQEVKVKVRINHHGIVMISGASLVEKKEGDETPEIPAGENVPTDEQQQAANTPTDSADVIQEACNENEDDNNTTTTSSASSPGGQGWAQRVKGWFSSGVDKKKKTSKLIDLPMEVATHGFAGEDLMNLVQMEANMIANDQKETERIDARNALEEYVYDLRNKLQGGPFERYVVDAERESICANLNDMENWLYEDGDDCDRDTYENKLKELKNRTNLIKERAHNFEMVPDAFNELKHVINMARVSVDEFRRGSAKYDHLTETDFLNVAESADKAAKWMEFNTGKFMSAPRTADSPVKLTEIQHEIDTLRMCLTTVINRPKPKPSAPKQEKNAGGNGEHPSPNNEQAEEHSKKPDTAKNSHATDKGANFGNSVTDDSTMDVD